MAALAGDAASEERIASALSRGVMTMLPEQQGPQLKFIEFHGWPPFTVTMSPPAETLVPVTSPELLPQITTVLPPLFSTSTSRQRNCCSKRASWLLVCTLQRAHGGAVYPVTGGLGDKPRCAGAGFVVTLRPIALDAHAHLVHALQQGLVRISFLRAGFCLAVYRGGDAEQEQGDGNGGEQIEI